MQRHNSKKKNLGFTLIEMSVVLLIIGILAGIVLRNIGGQSSDARDKKRVADLNQLGTLLVQYSSVKGYYPTTNATTTGNAWSTDFQNAFKDAGFIPSQLPLPPGSDVYEYFACARANAPTGTAFILRAKLERSATEAPAIYRQSYDSSSTPPGWTCNATVNCSSANNYFCYIQ